MKFFLFIWVCFVLYSTRAQNVSPILPTPKTYTTYSGSLPLKPTVTIDTADINVDVYDYLKSQFKGLFGIELLLKKENPDIRFLQIDVEAEDSYSINVEDNINIQYSSEQGSFYAVISLLQMVSCEEGICAIRKSFVHDFPRFGWRGLHLDVSRHFFSVDEVKRFIDLMVLYKFNMFHWHLTDDQGWRIEINSYPKLTEIGAMRDSTVIGHYSDSPREYKVEEYKGYYTQDEIREVVDYARKKYVTIVPEIEMPGHSRAALAAYPEYSCTGELLPVPGLWGVFDDILCSKEESIQFMQDILIEVLELFPSEYIHVGGDEAPKTRWKNCEKCQSRMKENGLIDEHELQSYFIQRMDSFLISKGRKLIGWDEILEGGLSPNAAVMSWRGDKGGIEAAKQAHYVVMSPTTYCYFDYYQSSHEVEPLAIGGFLPLEKVYKYSPVPKEIPEDAIPYILGGQANLWTEYITSMSHLEYMTYPRALALAQGLWCVDKPDYKTFLDTYLTYHERFLAKHEVNYAKSIHFPTMRVERGLEGIHIGFTGATENTEFEVHSSTIPMKDNDETTITMRNEDRQFIGRCEELDKKKYHFRVTNENLKDTFEYTIYGTSSLGLPVELVTPAHPKYNHNGSLNLVDGIFGSMPWKGSEWLGFRDAKIEMIVDLETEKEVAAVQLGFLENNGSWIYLPERVTIYVSDNKSEWKESISKEVDSMLFNDHSFGLVVSEKTRFLKIVIDAMDLIPEGMDGGGNTPWTFIDEIELLYPEEWK